MRTTLTTSIRISLRQHLLANQVWLSPLLIVIGLTGIGIVTHAVVLSEVVPPVSVTSPNGPERLPISWLWDRTTNGFDEVEP